MVEKKTSQIKHQTRLNNKVGQGCDIIAIVNKLLALSFLVIAFYSCNTIEGVKTTNYYDTCKAFNTDFGDLSTYQDPNRLFTIRLPYDWDVRESYSDTLYGIFAANLNESNSDITTLGSISAIGYFTTDSLENYAAKEIRGLKEEKGIKVKEAGKTIINGNNAIWILFKSEDQKTKKGNLVVYIKSAGKSQVFLLQASVYSSDNYKERLCNLKQILNTFKIL